MAVPGRTAARGRGADHAAGRLDLAAALALGRAAPQHQPADFGDRGQRLAAKPERADAEQIVGLGQFAGGVGGQGQRQLLDRNAAAVIDDPDHFQPALADRNVDPRRAGVDGVLHQLFHHARRPLDHLAGGDFVDQRWGKLTDGGHRENGPLQQSLTTETRRTRRKNRNTELWHSSSVPSCLSWSSFTYRRARPFLSECVAAIALPIAAVPIAFVRFPGDVAGAQSGGENLLDGRLDRAGGFLCFSEWRSSIAAERICAIGLAMSLPAMSGAEPPAGSYSPKPSALRLADGSIPIDPQTEANSSLRMSPNMLPHSSTSNRRGFWINCIVALST